MLAEGDEPPPYGWALCPAAELDDGKLTEGVKPPTYGWALCPAAMLDDEILAEGMRFLWSGGSQTCPEFNDINSKNSSKIHFNLLPICNANLI